MIRITLPADVDLSATMRMVDMLRTATGAIVIDGADVERIGIAGLQLLVSAQATAADHDAALTIDGESAALQCAMDVTGLGLILPSSTGPCPDAQPTDALSIDHPWYVHLRPDPDGAGGDPVPVLHALGMLGAIVLAVDGDAVPRLADLAPGFCHIGWTVLIPGSIEQATSDRLTSPAPRGYQVEIMPGHPLPIAAAADDRRGTGPCPVAIAPATIAATAAQAPGIVGQPQNAKGGR